jgi:hypothetical protein
MISLFRPVPGRRRSYRQYLAQYPRLRYSSPRGGSLEKAEIPRCLQSQPKKISRDRAMQV